MRGHNIMFLKIYKNLSLLPLLNWSIELASYNSVDATSNFITEL